MGIEQELMSTLFEPYSQAKLSIMRDHGGTGLGLAIVSRIIRFRLFLLFEVSLTGLMNGASMMGGTIFVESELGKGSSFSAQIVLPVAPNGVTAIQVIIWLLCRCFFLANG